MRSAAASPFRRSDTVGEEIDTLWERCLPLPGLYARVPRFRHIVIRNRRMADTADLAHASEVCRDGAVDSYPPREFDELAA